MSCCAFQDITGISLEESQLITSNQLFGEILTYSNINSNFTIYSCNQLSNLIQPQLDERSNLIYRDSNLNTIIHLTAQNPFYPLLEGKEIRFHTAENEFKTKINQDGELEVYHPLRVVPIPIDYPAAWWNVEEKLTFVIQDGIGLRFDVTNLQAGSGIGTITNEAEATAAAVASGAGLVGLGGVTGAAASTIAGGDYGSVALGVAGGALFSVLGYLSYQAQVGCNLSNLGFSNQFSNVNSNMSNANLLLTSNLYSITRAQGFINCNILSQQFVNNLKVSSLNLNNGNLTNLNTINGTTGIFGSLSTTNNTNEAIPSTNSFGGIGDKIIIKTGTSTTYPYSIGIENKALWISAEDNINFYNRGIKSLSLSSNNSTQIFGELLCNSNIKLNQTNISNIFVNSNLIYDKFYTDNRQYPPKNFTSSSSQSSITYLGQTPIYYETINLNTINISYGSGTYEIYSSENNTTSVSISGIGNNVSNVVNDDNYSYALFTSNGTFTTNSNLICDILIVGGGGGGGYDGGGGGGGGQVLYYTDNSVSFKSGNSITLTAGTYNINIGSGGTGSTATGGITIPQAQLINGTNGGTSSIINASTLATIVSSKGGAGGGSRNNVGNGGDVGGAGGNGHANSGASQISNNGGGSGGTNNGDVRGAGGGGGGANTSGTSKNGENNQPSSNRAGNGGAGVDINITGTNFGIGGGGGGGSWTYVGGTATHGGGSGNITNSNGSAQEGTANTGGGGGSGGRIDTGNPQGRNGGTGVVIIRFLKTSNQTKKELFNFEKNEVGSEFGSFNYNSSTGDYLSTDRYIKNDYYGDFLVVKLPTEIILNKYRIYSRPSFVERAPSLLRLYGSTNNINWEEINEGSITSALVVGNYSSGFYEKIVNNQIKSYSYFGIVVNKIIGGNSNANNLNFTEFELYGKEFVSFVPIYASSNVLSNTSNTIFNGYSNLNSNTSNTIHFNYSNLNSNTSNTIHFNYSNLNLNTSNNLFNYTSNNLFSSNSNIYATSNAVKYITLNEQPRLNKKSAFYCQTTNLIYPDGSTPYYSYHLFLPDYIATGFIQIGSGSGDTYRIFKIKCFFASMYFQTLTNGIPNICEYTIYMSNKASAAAGTIAGVNICAMGEPVNYYLNNLMKNRIFILRNNTTSSSFNFNYLSIITTEQADVRVFISDLLS